MPKGRKKHSKNTQVINLGGGVSAIQKAENPRTQEHIRQLEARIAKNKAEQAKELVIKNILDQYNKDLGELVQKIQSLYKAQAAYPQALTAYEKELIPLLNKALNLSSKVGRTTTTEGDRWLSKLKVDLFSLMPLNYREQEIDHVLEVLHIDLADWFYLRPAYGNAPEIDPNQNFKFTATSIIIDRLQIIWSQGKEQEARDLFEYFVSRGLNANSLQARNNVLLYTILEYSDNINFIQMLLDSNHIRINSVITSRTDDFRAITAPDIDLTAFNCAASYMQTDFDKFKTIVLLLLENGADISSKGKRGLEHFKKMFQSPKKSKTKEDETGINKFFKKLDEIVNEFFLSKLKKLQESSPEEQVVEADTTAQMSAEEAEPTLIVTMATSSVDGILAEYADFKNELSQNIDLPQEARTKYALEALFLKYIQTKDEVTKAQINALLVKNNSAEAREFYNQILSEVISSDEHAEEVFTSQDSTQNYFELVQKLLHFQPQTAHAVSVVEEEAQEVPLLVEVYPVLGCPNTFVYIHPDTLEQLSTNHKTKLQDLLTRLECIPQSSKNANGFKDYKRGGEKLNIAKIKIKGQDKDIASTSRYEDESGQTLIVFNKFLTHAQTDRALNSKAGVCEIREDITKMIFAPCSSESENSSSDHDSDVPPPPSEPYPDGRGPAMFPEDTSTLGSDAAFYPE